jgi:hypothetical protein
MTRLRGSSQQANYNDRETAACRRSYCQLLRMEDVAWSAQRIPTAVNLGFLDDIEQQKLGHDERAYHRTLKPQTTKNRTAHGH